MPYINPDLRTKLTPPLSSLGKYVQKAKATGINRDTRPLLSFLASYPQIDPHIISLMQTRRIALQGFQSRIQMIEGQAPSAGDKKRIAEMTARFQKSKISSLYSTVMNGIMFGMSNTRLIWENDTFLKTRVKEVVRYELTELDIDNKIIGGLLHVHTDDEKQTFTVSQLDPEENMIVRCNPLDGIDNNFLGSLAQANMIMSWLKYDDWFHWAKANDKFGDPTIWLEYMEGTDPKDVAKLERSLDQLSQASRAAFPSNIKMHLLEAARTSIADMHEKFIRMTQDQQSILYLGQTLTTSIGDKGSYAAAKVQDFVRKDILWGDINFVQDVMTDQYIEKDFRMNYAPGDSEFCPYVHRFDTEELGDFEANSRIIGNALDAGMSLSEEEAYRKIGYHKPGDGESVIGKQSTVIPPTGA